MTLQEALVEAGVTRFRPVMLTAITTILGLVPMALGISLDVAEMRLLVGGQSADFWGPMAVAVIFGLAFATVLTLVMVPLMYSITDSARRWLGGLWHRLRGTHPAARHVGGGVRSPHTLSRFVLWVSSSRCTEIRVRMQAMRM